MSESDFGLITLSGDFKNNFRVLPLALVFGEIEIVIQNEPDESFIRDELGYFSLVLLFDKA